MNIARRIAILAAIVGLLAATFLLSSISFVPGWALGVGRAIDSFELADRAFRSDLLGARIGPLRTYTELNSTSADQRSAILALQSYSARDAALGREVRSLANMVHQREACAQRFTSSDVLVGHSLSRFAALSGELPRSAALSVQMLRLTLDTDPLAVHQTQATIADLIRHSQGLVSVRKKALSAQLIAHARLLVRAIPETNALLGRILAFPIEGQAERIRRLATEEQRREDIARRHTMFGSTATIGAFLVFMISTRLRLILRSGALRRKVEAEHFGATVSALLIDAQSDDLPDRIERGLAALGSYMEVDCAFLVLRGDQDRVFSWSRTGALSAGLAADLADGASGERWDGDRLRITQNHAKISEAFARRIATAGLQSLKLVRAPGAEPFDATLGCGSAASHLKDGSDVLLVCRVTLAAILQAVRRDILEKERSQLERELQQARRMETIGAMATGVAHNFNNIMGAIGGFAEIAASHVPAISPAARNLEEISHAVHRARDLVDQILRFGRRHNEPRARLHIADLLAETAGMLRALNPRVEVRLSVEGELSDCSGLASQVQQVIMNIGQNAAHAMKHVGAIEIVAAYRSLSRPARLSHGRLPAGRYAVIDIVDRGSGIDAAILPRIFDPFFTTRKEGTGLGLSTAWEVMETHGGSIDVRSSARGSRFALWLPHAQGGFLSGSEDASGAGGRGDRVLLIANEPHRVDRDEELLAVLGYEPVAIIARAWPIELPALDMIDIVLLIETERDEALGAAALAQVRAAAAGHPVLLATDIAARRHLRLPGVIPLGYPLRVQELATALSTAVQSVAHRSVSGRPPD